jgi:hypothetical protein
MNYNNIVYFIGDENLYELIFNTQKGWKCRNLDTKDITFIQKNPININTIEWSGLTINEIFDYIKNNKNFKGSPLNELLTKRCLNWYNILEKNNINLKREVAINEKPIIEEFIQQNIIHEEPTQIEPTQVEIIEEKPKKKSRKKINP